MTPIIIKWIDTWCLTNFRWKFALWINVSHGIACMYVSITNTQQNAENFRVYLLINGNIFLWEGCDFGCLWKSQKKPHQNWYKKNPYFRLNTSHHRLTLYIYITKLENSNQVWKIVFSKTATIKLNVRKGNDYEFLSL